MSSVGGVGGVGPRSTDFDAGPAASGAAAALHSRMISDHDALRAVARGERELTVGERGPHVRAIQDALTSLRFPPAGGADGAFGRGTEAAIAAFQRANALPASGRLDARTILHLDARLTDTPVGPGGPPPRTTALPPPVPLTRGAGAYLAGRVEREAYDYIERRLWTGTSWRRGIDAAVTDTDTLEIMDKLETLNPKQYNNVLHALAATRVADEPFCPTLLDKFIVRGTSQFGHAALSHRFCDQLCRKLEHEQDNKILRHISPDSVDRLKGWADWQRLISLFA